MSSQRQSKTGRRRPDDDSESPVMSQRNKGSETLGQDEFQRKVSELVRYLLCQDKKKIPVKRQDINKNVMKEHVRSFQRVFDKARSELLNIFGIDVIESEIGKTKSYLLVNNLDTRNEDIIPWSRDVKNSGLLMTIMSLIYMSDGVLNEDVLRRTLKHLGIQKDMVHNEFGDADKTIQEFVKQSYIIKEKVAGADSVTYNYKLGVRSMAETSKRRILEFISEIYGVEIQQWKMQYKEIIAEESAQRGQVSQ